MEISEALTLKIAADQGEVGKAIAFFTDSAKRCFELSRPGQPINLFHFRLALDEALLNAIRHGCKNAKDAIVRITMRFNDGVIELTVEDPGLGFVYADIKGDWTGYFDTMVERVMKKGKGWGLAIIQSVTKALYWNARGNRITLVFVF